MLGFCSARQVSSPVAVDLYAVIAENALFVLAAKDLLDGITTRASTILITMQILDGAVESWEAATHLHAATCCSTVVSPLLCTLGLRSVAHKQMLDDEA